jgi:hypothetical protein
MKVMIDKETRNPYQFEKLMKADTVKIKKVSINQIK